MKWIVKKLRDPIGPKNNQYLLKNGEKAKIIIAAWGNDGYYFDQADNVKNMFGKIHYLILTNKGNPGHPLYLKKILKPKLWK